MKIFVTGYKGFIGRHLTPRLQDWKGYDGDILDKEQLTQDMAGCDAVVHLAGKFGKVNNDETIYKVNVIGTANVIQAMHANGIKRIVFTSSVGADERFKNAYDDSKFIAEKVLDAYGIDPIILRLSNLYGADQKDKLITSLIKGFKKGEIKVYGDGKQTRDLVYVEDVVQAILLSLVTLNCPFSIVIGSGKSYSILQVIKIMSKISGIKPKIKFLPTPYNDFGESSVNLAQAGWIGYKPKYTLEKVLKEIWKY